MKNLAYKTGYFHGTTTRTQVGPVSAQMPMGGVPYVNIAPGMNGQLRVDMTCPAPGDFEGNPDLFARVTWLAAPTVSDPHYPGVFRWTALEDSGIRSARVMQGKTVTLSMQFRCPGASPSTLATQIALIVWRGNCNVPPAYRTPPWTDYSMQLWSDTVKPIYGGPTVQRLDFTFVLPTTAGFVPDANQGDDESYLGIGFDIIGQSIQGGGVLDIGPYQFNEGGPCAIEELPRV